MMSQTFSSRYDFDALVLNGHLVQLGAFTDIKSHSSSDREISIGFTIETNRWSRENKQGVIEYSCIFGKRPYLTANDEDEHHPVVLESSVRLQYIDKGKLRDEYVKIRRRKEALEQPSDQQGNSSLLYDVEEINSPEIESLQKEFPDLKIIGFEGNSFIPNTLQIEYNHAKKIGSEIVALITGNTAISSAERMKNLKANATIPMTFFIQLERCIDEEREDFLQSNELPPELKNIFEQVAGKSKITVDELLKQWFSLKFGLQEYRIPAQFLSGESVPIVDWLNYLQSTEPKIRKPLIELMDKRRSDLQQAWDIGAKSEWKTITISLRNMFYLSSFLASYFSRSFKYLGPLRNEPQAIYSAQGQLDPKNVGLKGEFTAAVLHINRNRQINYPSPKLDEDGNFTFSERKASLSFACKEWLSYLGVVSDYNTVDKGKLGYEIYVKTTAEDRWQDLTHVGVGVSQVVPIVLMFLLSDPDDILVFEQPELHLHPKIQSRLCDFFVAMAASNRQSIIETHSEYLINRLRLRIAQTRVAAIEEISSVYFIVKSKGQSVIKNVEINKYGAVLDWPDDFFDQSDFDVENILLEAAKKRKGEKEFKNAASSA